MNVNRNNNRLFSFLSYFLFYDRSSDRGRLKWLFISQYTIILKKRGMRGTAVLWITSLSLKNVEYVIGMKDRVGNKGVLGMGPSDSQVGVQKHLPSTGIQHRHFIPVDPSLEVWVFRSLFVSKQDKQSKREEIKDKSGCCSFFWLSLHLDFQLYS